MIPGGKNRGRDSQGTWDEHVHTTLLKWIINKDLLHSTCNSAQCYVAAWMGGEFEGEWTYVYESLLCSRETSTVLFVDRLYSNTKYKGFLKRIMAPEICELLTCVNVHSVAQLCPILCNPMNCSLPDSSVHGIFQAKILEWVTISYFKGSS